jgi:glycosyltransferase involved in cell wall biosynthesis
MLKPTFDFYRWLFANRQATVFAVTLPAVLISGFFCRIFGVQQIVLFAGLGNTFHGRPNFFRGLLKTLIKFVTKSPVASIIAHNSAIEKYLLDGGYCKSVTVIRGSGIDETIYHPPVSRVMNNPPRILFFGRMLREKGVVEFIDAAKVVLDSGLNAEFILAGRTDSLNPTSLSEKEIYDSLENRSMIRWVGQSNNVQELLATSDIVCLPSYHEGLPRSLLEAALMGCCLVATDIPGSREIVIAGQTGILVAPKSSGSLADGFSFILKNQQVIQRYAANSRNHVLENFTNKIILPQYLHVIEIAAAAR